MPGVDVRIDDSGEILVRSVSVIDGYFGGDADPDKPIINGWLHTGDSGYLDPHRELIVLGGIRQPVPTRSRAPPRPQSTADLTTSAPRLPSTPSSAAIPP